MTSVPTCSAARGRRAPDPSSSRPPQPMEALRRDPQRATPTLETHMAVHHSLQSVAAALRALVGETSFPSITTRVLLRTGVNLRAPRPDQLGDAGTVRTVVGALKDLGYAV